LPTGYNKDLQEDKEALFDAADTLETLLPALIGTVETMRLQPEAMRAALDESMLATDLADYLVQRGVPFREAHALVGAAVRTAQAQGIPLAALPLPSYQAISAHFQADLYSVFDFDAAIGKRKAFGGTAPEAVRQQIERAEAFLQARDV
jgi:argininosuccinate lyase